MTKNVVSTFYAKTGGDPWDDGILFNGVKKMTIYSGDFIDSIEVVYDRDGYHIRGAKHGGDGGDVNTVRFNSN